jgi:hypothetical protein
VSGFLVRRSRIAAKAEAGHYVLSGNSAQNSTIRSRGPGIAPYSREVWLSNSASRSSSIADWGCGTQVIAVTPIDATARE